MSSKEPFTLSVNELLNFNNVELHISRDNNVPLSQQVSFDGTPVRTFRSTGLNVDIEQLYISADMSDQLSESPKPGPSGLQDVEKSTTVKGSETISDFEKEISQSLDIPVRKFAKYSKCVHRQRKGDLHTKCELCRGYICDFDHRCPECSVMDAASFRELMISNLRKQQRAKKDGKCSEYAKLKTYDVFLSNMGSVQKSVSKVDKAIKVKDKVDKGKSDPTRERLQAKSSKDKRTKVTKDTVQDKIISDTTATKPNVKVRRLASPLKVKIKKSVPAKSPPRSKTIEISDSGSEESQPNTVQAPSIYALLTRPSISRPNRNLKEMKIDPTSEHFLEQISQMASYLSHTKQTVTFFFDGTVRYRKSILATPNDLISASNTYKTTTILEQRGYFRPISTDSKSESENSEIVATAQPVRVIDVHRAPTNPDWSDTASAGRCPIRTPDFTKVPQMESESLRVSHFDLNGESSDFPIQFDLARLVDYHDIGFADLFEFPSTDPFQPNKPVQGIATLNITRQLLETRVAENFEIDNEYPGRPYSKLIPTQKIAVVPTQYDTTDFYLPIDALWWPDEQRLWLPAPPKPNTDVPITEIDVRYLERLSRTVIRIANMQLYTLECLKKYFEANTPDVLSAHVSVPKSICRVYEQTGLDALKIAIELVTSFVNLRRDAVIQHARIPPTAALWLRNRSFADSIELFDSDEIHKIHDFTARHLTKTPHIVPPLKLDK